MAINKTVFVTAALAVVSAIAPGPKSLAGSYSGSWSGTENYQLSLDGQTISSGTLAGTLNWFYDDTFQFNEISISGSDNSYADVIGSGLSGTLGGGVIDQTVVATVQGEYSGFNSGYWYGLPGVGDIFAGYQS